MKYLYSISSRHTSRPLALNFFTTFTERTSPSVAGQCRLRTPRVSACTLRKIHHPPTRKQTVASSGITNEGYVESSLFSGERPSGQRSTAERRPHGRHSAFRDESYCTFSFQTP